MYRSFAFLLAALTLCPPALAVDDDGLSLDETLAGDRLRLSKLDHHLAALDSRSRLFRYLSAGGLAAGGAVAIVAGVSDDSDEAKVLGSFALGAGGLLFFIRSGSESLYARFIEMPESSTPEIVAKIDFGEIRLSEIATTARNLRYGSAAITTGVGLGFLVGAARGRRNWWLEEMYSDFLVGVGVAVTAAGLAQFLISTPVEDSWNSYREMVREPKRVSWAPYLTTTSRGPGMSFGLAAIF